MYLVSSALLFYIDWDFLLGCMGMDLSSVLAAVTSSGVLSFTGKTIQVASPQGCTRRPAGPEPSGSFIQLQEYLHGSRGYQNAFPAGPTPPFIPQGTQIKAVSTPEVKISLPLCCVTEGLRVFPCSSP